MQIYQPFINVPLPFPTSASSLSTSNITPSVFQQKFIPHFVTFPLLTYLLPLLLYLPIFPSPFPLTLFPTFPSHPFSYIYHTIFLYYFLPEFSCESLLYNSSSLQDPSCPYFHTSYFLSLPLFIRPPLVIPVYSYSYHYHN